MTSNKETNKAFKQDLTKDQVIDSMETNENTIKEEKSETEETQKKCNEKDLVAEIEEAKNTIEELKDKYLRLSAEFDNYRKRSIKEKTELMLNGGEKVITAILPIIDDLERALLNMEKSEELNPAIDGVKLIYHKFMKILEQQGVKEIETKDMDFDTDYHEAIAMIPAPSDNLKGKILDCIQTGYTLNDKVIRHARVAVGQ